MNIKTYQTANFLKKFCKNDSEKLQIMQFSLSFCLLLTEFFFRSEQKFLSVLYHWAKSYKFSPSTFRDIFDRNINFAKFSVMGGGGGGGYSSDESVLISDFQMLAGM